jgi:acetylornithine/N-succinyldiaminopimelate aminotransferase
MSAILPTYARAALAFERGEGAWLWTADGRRFLDYGAGIAVTSLGHAHPHLVSALKAQADKLWHTSNLYTIAEGERFAERLVKNTFADFVFFANSGAEANEGAVKIARKYHYARGDKKRTRIITFEGCFHGRTLGMLAATNNAKYLEGFGEKALGFDQVPYGDFKALKAMISDETAAIMIEPIQGEGGLRPVPKADLIKIRELCDKHGLLLIFDEIQCGMGRTGAFLCAEHSGVEPDICSLAKALGGGFPVGASLVTAKAGAGMVAGTHGSTYGGNPLAMAVGNAVLDIILEKDFLDSVSRKASFFQQKLAYILSEFPDIISEIRGQGLMLGLKCVKNNGEVATACREAGLLVVPAGDNVIRLLPPLITTEAELSQSVEMIAAACKALRSVS